MHWPTTSRSKPQIDYADIPHFPLATVEFHSGKLLFGMLAGKAVVVMQGRFHFYEGYTMQQVTFPVRVLHALGVRTLLVSNAAGGMNPDFQTSDLMVIDDHISLLLPQNPLISPNPPDGDRFPDMSEPYRKTLIDRAFALAPELGIALKRGVYVSVTGPQLETRAEYRMLRQWGADAVGYVDRARGNRGQSDGHGRVRRVDHYGYVLTGYPRKGRHPENHCRCRLRRTAAHRVDAGNGWGGHQNIVVCGTGIGVNKHAAYIALKSACQ